MSDAKEIVKLRTGVEVPKSAVRALVVSLEVLWESNITAFYESVMIARNPDHTPFGNTGEILENYALTVHGVMHDLTRNIILAATEGDDKELRIVSPIDSTS